MVVRRALAAGGGAEALERELPGRRRLRHRREPRRLEFTVVPKQYAEQRLKVANQRHVEPSKEDLERIAEERQRIDAALGTYTAERQPVFALEAPLAGRRSSSFGLRRYFNDQPRNPHSGMDIAAPTGTPVRSPAPGRIVEAGDFFFNGKTVFVDHGQGMVTMYCHLSRIDVATGDLGSSAARKFDMEAWIPTQGTYREITSTSNTTEFQARRLRIRMRDEDGTRPLATLNGTLCAMPRVIVAILENHQQADGSVRIPRALRPFLGGREAFTPVQ